MAISCQLKTLFGEPVEGVFVELKCEQYPEQHFSGISDKSGMIDEWMSISDQKVRRIRYTPNMQGSHLQMRTHAQPVFGEMPLKTWNRIRLPQRGYAHILFLVHRDMYATIKDGASLVETPGTGLSDLTFIFASSESKNNLPGPQTQGFNFGTLIPYDRAHGLEESGTAADVSHEARWQAQRVALQPKQLRRSARLAKQ
ncbi:hypothetical protein VFPPC_11630 [Pochonia chlamydosporia 170]|uniref:Uncharacterized protein n=1 Tax=Pochonia chlamydosporia 170 TaxID=1380566 RepID=A0A179FW11_METCM|nr:hypothetical protein VFPPC_11630 [Pochonia chlamydosporia 170]OAQ69263.1 hypothetical protein VFPPC_11630 [Pochonia chlamydosporia 170]